MALMRRESAESNALRRMRFSVTLACLFIVVSFMLQILIWGFASYTDVRFVRSTTPTAHRDPAVVVRESDQSVDSGSGTVTRSTHAIDSSLNDINTILPSSTEPILDARMQYSSADTILRLLHQLSIAFAWIGFVLLFVETTLAVVVAGSLNSPGISHVVRTQLWASLLLAVALPWSSFLPSFPIPSLMGNYPDMTNLADQYRTHLELSVSSVVFFGRFLLMPLAVMGGAVWVVWLFHKGTAAVVEKAGPTDFEIEIEKETAGRQAGSVMYGGRAQGVLQLTVPSPSSPPSSPSSPPSHTVADSEMPKSKQPLMNAQENVPTKFQAPVSLNTGTGVPVQSFVQEHPELNISDSSVTPPVDDVASEEDEPHRRPI